MCKPILQNRSFPQVPFFAAPQKQQDAVNYQMPTAYGNPYVPVEAYNQKPIIEYTMPSMPVEDVKVEVSPDQFMDFWATVKDIAAPQPPMENIVYNNQISGSSADFAPKQDTQLELVDLDTDISPLFDILLDDDVAGILNDFDLPVDDDLDDDDDLSSPKAKASHHKTCTYPGCTKFVRSRGLCKAHGGSLQCVVEGCSRQSQGNGLCIKHGGGRRCEIDGCSRAAQSNHRCKKHGGGQRCSVSGCNKSSQGGGLCRSHGGGQRCGASGCPKGAQRDGFCAAHGGIRLCSVEGCTRNDRGGGKCAYHGGGKRCKIDACIKPSRKHGLCAYHFRVIEGPHKGIGASSA